MTQIIQFFAEYLKGKPITDVLLIVLIGVFIWTESNHGQRTDKAHKIAQEMFQERDMNEQLRAAANERNTDRIITALTGVKTEIKKTTAEVQNIPVAAAAAASIIVEKKATEDAKSREDPQGG